MPRVTHVRTDGCYVAEFPGERAVIERRTSFGGLRVYVPVPDFVGRALLRQASLWQHHS